MEFGLIRVLGYSQCRLVSICQHYKTRLTRRRAPVVAGGIRNGIRIISTPGLVWGQLYGGCCPRITKKYKKSYSVHSETFNANCHFLKPFWNEELDRLKPDSVFWHDMWFSAGRPKTGEVQRIRLTCKAKYKLGIINAYVAFEDKLSDEVCYHFNNKNVPEFWKSLNAKFRKNVSRMLILMALRMMLALPVGLLNT